MKVRVILEFQLNSVSLVFASTLLSLLIFFNRVFHQDKNHFLSASILKYVRDSMLFTAQSTTISLSTALHFFVCYGYLESSSTSSCTSVHQQSIQKHLFLFWSLNSFLWLDNAASSL